MVGLVSERFDPQPHACRIQYAHHDLLAVERGQRAHPEVDRAVLRKDELHAAVLRHALLRDVEPGNHLDARRHLVLDDQRRLRHFLKQAVEPVADAEELLVGLEMDVGDARGDGVEQNLLQVPHHGRVFDVRVLFFAG